MHQKRHNLPGLFISFEGIEGVGKSTQTQLLKKSLESLGYTVVLSREPGGTDLGDSLRKCLLTEYSSSLSAQTELCILLASRIHHIDTLIKPALAKGLIVIVDRFIDASIAYQGFGRQLGMDLVEQAHQLFGLTIQPDLTFVLDLSVTHSRERTLARGESDRIEKENDLFFQRVQEGYLNLAKMYPARIHVLDASMDKDALALKIFEKVKGLQ